MTKEERMEKARALHKQGCNCCQAVVNVAAPFGRGLAGTREVCGCVSGMAMVCGLTQHSPDTRTLIEKFRQSNGDIVCGRLLAAGKKPCGEMVAEAAGLLSDIL